MRDDDDDDDDSLCARRAKDATRDPREHPNCANRSLWFTTASESVISSSRNNTLARSLRVLSLCVRVPAARVLSGPLLRHTIIKQFGETTRTRALVHEH